MKFDKSKVYTPFNADEVKVGSKGYFADCKETLISKVQSEKEDFLWTLDKVEPTSEVTFYTDGCPYEYFYLIEEPKKPKKRPCTMTELLDMLKKQDSLPLLKLTDENLLFTIGSISDSNVFIGKNYSYEELCNYFTLIDGTPLWIKEQTYDRRID